MIGLPLSGVATDSAFLSVGFSFDDELEYMHLNVGGKGGGIGLWGSGLWIRNQLSAVALPPLVTDD